ncbi:MAG TPA: hypothetical protein PKA00_10870 [Saprospiraceae bacterium]|nr:hypothetical protein [Saprospiraceae bacterium]HMQ83404.1 hypothetical protein [Saprospiraceae bacterium]
MYELEEKYLQRLEEIATDIQNSDILQQYLEEEEEEYYTQLKELYEPAMKELYDEVAEKDPLQLISLETVLLAQEFEGLYLPRILGYAVLRGELSADYKYVRPQNHFKDVLMAICESANFDILRKRIGQSIQMGFALSSDIWVTNLINSLDNKKIRYFLQSQKVERYHFPEERQKGLVRYKRQFTHDNFYTAIFPNTVSELKIQFQSLKQFLLYRVRPGMNNESIVPHLKTFVENKDFQGHTEHLEIMSIYAAFFSLDEAQSKLLAKHFNAVRKSFPDFEERFLNLLLELHHSQENPMTPQADLQLATLIDYKQEDSISRYFELMRTIHTRGYVNVDVQEAVQQFYSSHEGLSIINECVRLTILGYFTRFINNLEVGDYSELFEISKLYPVYISIFANQKFNQDLKELSLHYVQKLLLKYTDKRGKDYQDIKKFVSTAFVDFGFLTEKEVVEMFKTRRKKKKEE